MTKADIAETISARLITSQRESLDLVEAVLELVKGRLERGETVKISGFGIFEVKQKKDRRGRKPQTGEDLTIEARRVLTFRLSPLLKRSLTESLRPLSCPE
ncbi:integration host factor subunit alpha [Geobacter pickeringii]|uniref:Integration host factor subunit alpha n=1 Tax=Geobacter pickeringii TaxID=345632 RepID=A0A0B5BDN4_9BACT|nr:integration host factor subunit alpha [Geobacter pickeringii]AJE02186.1 integration host factor subunit alpha [Geobacter pickeringii]